jgi:transcriptional regulator with XRE-family HTH domain
MSNELKKTARNYSSSIINDFLALEDPIQTARIATRMQLAAAIADAMKAKGFHKKTFAAALKQHPSIITKWLSGKHHFTTDTLTDIGRVLDIQFFAHEIKPLPEVRIQLHLELYSTANKNLVVPPSGNPYFLNASLPLATR